MSPASAIEGHLSVAALADWLSGALPTDELARVEKHLDVCPSCMELVATTGRALQKIGGARSTPSQAVDTPRESAAAIPLSRGTAVGRYLVLGQLGVGGMGVVYAGYDSELQRRVALKLLRPGSASSRDESRARVLREAQALARLSHPNVVAVYESGAHQEEVFVALELIDGSTLRDWLGEKPRGWREIVDVFVQAGRGLAAAHAVGIVHRDFKPDNALIGRDGRVRVTDFGLARVAAEEGARALADGDIEVTRLTATGALLGSPAYMAPEQMDGAATDARADQFSFSVALFEALFGERPFAGETVRELRAAISSAAIREGKGNAPAWIRRALVRGLAADPAQRFPSMQAMLEELGRDPNARVRRALIAASALAVLAVAFGASRVFIHQRAQLCSSGEAQVSTIWNANKRAAIEAKFLETKAPFAADAFAGAARALDAWSGSWAAMQKSSCEATRVRGEQSEEMLDLRAGCLDRRLNDESALVDLFVRADAKIVENAARAAATLPSLESCASAEALRAVPLPPPAQADTVKSLREATARADALQRAGKFADGGALAKETLASARKLDFAPLTAEALASLGALQLELGDAKATKPTLIEASDLAEATRQPLLAARSLISLASLIGDRLHKPDEGRVIAAHARSLLDGYGGDADQRIKLMLTQGWIEDAAGDYPSALAITQRAMALAEKVHGPEDASVASAANSVGEELRNLGRLDEALAMHQRSVTVWEKAVGASHPKVATALNNLAGDLRDMQRPAEAIAVWQRALEIREKALGPDHPDVGATLGNLATTHYSMHELDAAEAEAQRSLAIKEKAFGPQSPAIAFPLLTLSNIKQNHNDTPAALVLMQRALAVREAGLGPEHPLTLESMLTCGLLLDISKRFDEAVAMLTQATVLAEKILGPKQILTGALIAAQGIARLHAGDAAAAEPLLLRSMPMMKEHPAADAFSIIQTNFALGQIAWTRDHTRGLKLAHEALDGALAAGASTKAEQKMIGAWIAARERH